jgi:hypothetical protein
MAFKPKCDKQIEIDKNDLTTLDTKHNEFLEKFWREEEEEIPKLLKEREKILNKRQKNFADGERIKEIDGTIRRMRKAKKDYFLQNSKHIFEYFENKQKVSQDITKPKMLDSFFNINKTKRREPDMKNQTIVNTYLSNVDESFIDIENYLYNKDVCDECDQGELIPIDYEGIMVCNKCFKQTKYLLEQEKPSYKDPPKEVSFYAYKRINHFREILAQFQAKETTQIPEKLIEDLKRQIKKERVELKDLSNELTKGMLKKLGYNKYYEHIPFIKDKLGIKPPIMSQDLEEKLCTLFLEIQRPYMRVCPDDRVNFLNYYYTIYKLCELLNQHQFLEYFPLLKDRDKRIEQDDIWKKICKELNWKFYPTL